MEHHFFAYISRMKFIQRWGLMRNTIPENDMEHALQTAMFAHAIAVIGVERYHRAYNPEHIMALALYHDGAEVITGDLPTPIKHHNPAIKLEYNKLEEIAADKLLSMLPNDLRPAYAPLIRHDETTDEEPIVKAADKLCAYIKCLEELRSGNGEFTLAAEQTRQKIMENPLPEVTYFMENFMPAFGMTLDELTK